VIELLRKSISDVIRENHSRFSLSSLIQIAFEMLGAIKEIHNQDFIYQGIKPVNFLFRNSEKYPNVGLYLDLIRPYKSKRTGKVKNYS
jgi:serine/threonine protein kinase